MSKGTKGPKRYIPLERGEEACPSEPEPDPKSAAYVFIHFIRPCLAELLGVMLFVFVVVTSTCRNKTGTARIATSLAQGFTLFVTVAATAKVSGGHLNPAVTLAMTIVRGLNPIILAPFYVLSQLLGAIIGAALARAVMPSSSYEVIKGGAHMLAIDVDPGQGILAEAVATSILVLAVLMVAFDDRNKSVLGPLAIGLAVAGGIFAIGDISGGSMNPARSFGPAVVGNYWKYHYVYWVGPILGSLFSTLMYGLFLASPNRLWLPIYEPVD